MTASHFLDLYLVTLKRITYIQVQDVFELKGSFLAAVVLGNEYVVVV
jgi:hypothetical protein